MPSITLSISEPTQYHETDTDGWKISINVTAATDIPEEIFVHRGDGVSPTFSHVATPADLINLPTDPEGATAPLYYYRKSSVDIVANSPLTISEYWNDMYEEIVSLVRAWYALDQLSVTSEVTVTYP